MGYTIERLNNRKFLVTRQDTGAAQAYQLAMLSHNSIGSLLGFSMRYVNSESYYYYDITGLTDLKGIDKTAVVSAEAVSVLVAALYELSVNINEYLLDMDRVLLAPEYVYTDAGLDRFLFVYAPDSPAKSGASEEGLRRLFEFVLQHFDHTENREDTVMVYGIYSQILKGTFDPAVYMHAMKQGRKEDQENSFELPEARADTPVEFTETKPDAEGGHKAQSAEGLPGGQKKRKGFRAVSLLLGVVSAGSAALLIYPRSLPFERNSMMLLGVCVISAFGALIVTRIGQRPTDTEKGKMKGKRTKCEKLEIQEIKEAPAQRKETEIQDFSGKAGTPEPEDNTVRLQTEYPGENDKRALFDDATSPLPMVEDESAGMYLDDGNGRVFEIDNLPFVIGTNAVCDARLSDRTVSRRHVKLFRIGERLAAADLGSTNGTWLNGQKLEAGESRLLKDGDVLGLGTGHFTVHILE